MCLYVGASPCIAGARICSSSVIRDAVIIRIDEEFIIGVAAASDLLLAYAQRRYFDTRMTRRGDHQHETAVARSPRSSAAASSPAVARSREGRQLAVRPYPRGENGISLRAACIYHDHARV